MIRTATIVAGLVALSASATMAQTYDTHGGATNQPDGATGASRTRDVGGQPNVGANRGDGGTTSSSSMLEQRNKQESARGDSSSHYNTKP